MGAGQRTVTWAVYRKGQLMDVVFYTSECDASYVRSTLINHDDYPADIEVRRVPTPK